VRDFVGHRLHRDVRRRRSHRRAAAGAGGRRRVSQVHFLHYGPSVSDHGHGNCVARLLHRPLVRLLSRLRVSFRSGRWPSQFSSRDNLPCVCLQCHLHGTFVIAAKFRTARHLGKSERISLLPVVPSVGGHSRCWSSARIARIMESGKVNFLIKTMGK
jgi:hypothetical protein